MIKNEETKNAWEFLQKNRLATLATIAANALIPQAALVYYLTDDSHKIYIATEQHSQKITNIAKNNHVAVVIGQEKVPVTLQIEGTADIITDSAETKRLIGLYAIIANDNDSDSLPPLLHIAHNSQMAFIAITINTYKFSDFSQQNNRIIIGTPADW